MLILLLFVVAPVLCSAQPGPEVGAQSLLSAFTSYTDLRIGSVQKSLEILAATKEARSGKWDGMKRLVAGYQRSEKGLIVWFMLPNGTYYTADKGLMDVKLKDRSYFPALTAGRTITGALVVSKSTGQRSAVIAIPMTKRGKVIGAVGASLFLDVLSDQVGSVLSLPEGTDFFALAEDGLTTLHRKTDRHFLDPREQGSDTLKNAVNEMLSRASGDVTYEFDGITKKALYKTSPLTQWRFAIISSGK